MSIVFTHHECTDKDEIGLLQSEGAFPVDHGQSHHPKVPDPEGKGEPVDGKVVHLEDVPGRVCVCMWRSLACSATVVFTNEHKEISTITHKK